jgi:hypothetical protein
VYLVNRASPQNQLASSAAVLEDLGLKWDGACRPRNVPKSFKEFIMGIDADLSPEEAQLEYDRYLAQHFGSELRASFERNKHKEP